MSTSGESLDDRGAEEQEQVGLETDRLPQR